MKRGYTLLAAVALTVLLFNQALAHHDFPQAQSQWETVCLSGQVLVETQPDGSALVTCYGTEATPVPATETAGPTDTPAATDTPEPTPTTGPTPTVPVPPTATAVAGVAPFPGAPLCGGHNNRAYHGLWNEFDACHFDHQHGDNPHDLDAVLGTDLYTRMGGEISYPWMTFSAAGQENDLKHAGYIWHVRTGIPCEGVPSPCITDFRALVHQHSVLDSAVQYHSYVFEAATSDGGYVFFGGWVDFGDLHVPEGNIVVNAPDNHDSTACTGAGRHKQHQAGGAPQIIWYGASRQTMDCGPRGFITLSSTIHDAFTYTNPNTGGAGPYACWPAVGCTANATLHRPHLIALNMIARWPFIYANGRANWEGYADRYGLLHETSECAAYSADCAPVVFRNLQQGWHYRTANSATAGSFHEHDIFFNGQSSGWSQPVP